MADNLLFPGCVKEYIDWGGRIQEIEAEGSDAKTKIKAANDLIEKEIFPVLQKDCKQIEDEHFSGILGSVTKWSFGKAAPITYGLLNAALKNGKNLREYLSDLSKMGKLLDEFCDCFNKFKLKPETEDLQAITIICNVSTIYQKYMSK